MVPHLRGLKDYKYMAVLGRGHFGKVLLAEDLAKKELVAIKVWREREKERERERECVCVCRRFSEEIEVDSIVSKNFAKKNFHWFHFPLSIIWPPLPTSNISWKKPSQMVGRV